VQNGGRKADKCNNMPDNDTLDYYEALQVNATAEPDTIHRIYRLLAQRFHPDNRETGDAARFRVVHEAYAVLSDPEKRAKYDVLHHQRKQDRWRLVSAGAKAEDDFELEQISRLTVLEALHAKRRLEPGGDGMPVQELEALTGRPREHLEFTVWYLAQKKLVQRDDSARLLITADGVDFLEQNYRSNQQRRRLQGATASAGA
jgi:curved DNA-binding protein CbpA